MTVVRDGAHDGVRRQILPELSADGANVAVCACDLQPRPDTVTTNPA